MKICQIHILLLLITFSLDGMSQEIPEIENLLDQNGLYNSEAGYEEMVATLQYLIENPININSANFDTLKMLFFLSDSQIDQLLYFRKIHGSFNHPSELLLVPGIGKRDLNNILPFITLNPLETEKIPYFYHPNRHELLARIRVTLPKQEGYRMYPAEMFDKRSQYESKSATRFHGPPLSSMIKYKYTHQNKIQAGVTLENDAGEGFFTRHQPMGFDFISAHIKITGQRSLQQVIIGDFRTQWGQGLVAWGGFSSGKSDVAVNNEKAGKGFSPYTSTDENNYMRGVATTWTIKNNLLGDAFVSYKKTDGNLTAKDTLSSEDLVSVTLYESGYHRNDKECSKKHQLNEICGGMSLRYNTAVFRSGINIIGYHFNPSLIPSGQIYQQYNDSGKKRITGSIDYKTGFRSIYFFGETAIGNCRGWATVNGIRISFPWATVCALYRRYDKKYVSHYASGFGEYGNTSNEEGIYSGIEFLPFKGGKINFSFDRFRFFSARYRASMPAPGWELLAEGSLERERSTHLLRYKREVKPEDLQGGIPSHRIRQDVRYQINLLPSNQWELRTRISMALYRKETKREEGFMINQDIHYTSPNNTFKIQGRVAWFNTDSYQSRIYAYENNVLYSYSFPSFMGKGWRTYLNLNWKPYPWLTCYVKSGMTYYPSQQSISSGVTKIDGNKRYDLAVQVRIII